jgi:paraquat-inducible protein B
MSKSNSKTVIGVFVVIAVALVVFAVVILGSGKFFSDKPKYVMFFDGSVKGLAVGSPVVFRGVKVGSVTKIGVALNLKDLTILIPVYIQLGEADIEPGSGTMGKQGSSQRKEQLYAMTDALIKRGLRAQLEMQSIVTGQLQIALDFYPDKPVKLVGADRRYREIPTIPTSLQELSAKLEKIPIGEVVEKMQSVLTGIDNLVNSPDMKQLSKSLGKTVEEAQTLLHKTDEQLQPLLASIKKTSDSANAFMVDTDQKIDPVLASIKKTSDAASVALGKLDATMSNLENMTGEDSILVYRINRSLGELERASRSVRALSDSLDRQPESLIFGKKNVKGE